ncbi:hypothetical protein [uncultured Alistipes sp.]|uniref:hypothetical protein n=1 Tax=uncultured Alistipes sp. TaxID=538949 RepID=UPI00261175EF|nr:hypothetical protein [uncultured Alistipes sp.]
MKTKILHWTSVLLASSALLLSACSEDDGKDTSDPTPVFPDMATLNIPAGETSCNVSFTPNMDWTVSIPTDAETSEWFKLSDGVVETSSISGKASTEPVTIQVITTVQDVYDETPSCEVSLTMGGQTQVIAKVTRQIAAREFDIYLSGFLTDEGTQEAFDFSFEYSETPVAKYTESSAPEVAPEGAPELIWFTGKTGYMQVVKAESNFEWLASTPDWLTVTARPQKGEYFVTADFAQITEQEINGAIGMIDFYDRNIDPTATDPGNNAHNRYCFVLPNLTKVVRNGSGAATAAFSFNAEGYAVDSNGTVSEEKSSTGSLYSAKDVVFYIGEKKGEWYYGYEASQHDWVTIADSWDETGSAFQLHDYTVSVKANEGETREVLVIALPKALAEKISDPNMDLFNTEGTDIKEEYKQYVFATIEQEGEGGGGSDDGFSISESESNQMYQPLGYYTFEDLTNGDPDADEDIANNWDVIAAGGKLYRLTYKSFDLMGSISFLLNGEYANIIASSTGNWLGTESYDNEINVTMDASGNTYTGGQGFIRIYDSNYNQLACIICIREF